METQANGITISYDLRGTGPVVTMIHGMALDRTMWWQQVSALSPRYSTLAYDVRGHGQSAKPAGPYSVDLFVADLYGLLGALGIARTCVMGLSMGGVIAQAFTLAHPEVVSSLILVSTRSYSDDTIYQAGLQRAAKMEAEGLASVAEWQLEHSFTAAYRQRRPDIVERFRQTILASDPRGVAACTRANAAVTLTDQLPRVQCPTLVVVGEEDEGTPPAMAEIIQRQIAGSRLVVVPANAHLVPVAEPELFNQTVLDFLAALPAS